jgi:uncharacterized membrane protein
MNGFCTILVAKTLTYRVLATIETTLIGYILTGDFKKGLQIGLLDTIVKLFTYYAHEICWLPCMKKINATPLETKISKEILDTTP